MSARLAVALLTALVQLRGIAGQQLRGSMATANFASAAAHASVNSSMLRPYAALLSNKSETLQPPGETVPTLLKLGETLPKLVEAVTLSEREEPGFCEGFFDGFCTVCTGFASFCRGFCTGFGHGLCGTPGPSAALMLNKTETLQPLGETVSKLDETMPKLAETLPELVETLLKMDGAVPKSDETLPNEATTETLPKLVETMSEGKRPGFCSGFCDGYCTACTLTPTSHACLLLCDGFCHGICGVPGNETETLQPLGETVPALPMPDAAAQQLRGSVATANYSPVAPRTSLNSSSTADEGGMMAAAGFSQYQVPIGASCNSVSMCNEGVYNRKCVVVSDALQCPSYAGNRGYRLNTDWPDATDRFSIYVPEGSPQLVCAQRLDNRGGWSMNLLVQCSAPWWPECCDWGGCSRYNPETHWCSCYRGGCSVSPRYSP